MTQMPVKIRAKDGNMRYEYYQSLNFPETVLLIDCWKNQASIDAHHTSPMMQPISELREKYDLHIAVERYVSTETIESDDRFIRR